MTTTQVVKTSVTVNNSPTQNYAHPKNHAPGHLLTILYPNNIKSDNRPYYSFWYPLMAKYVQDIYSATYYVKIWCWITFLLRITSVVKKIEL